MIIQSDSKASFTYRNFPETVDCHKCFHFPDMPETSSGFPLVFAKTKKDDEMFVSRIIVFSDKVTFY